MYLDAAFSKSIQFCVWFLSADANGNVKMERVEFNKNLNLLGETYIDSSKSYRALDTVPFQFTTRSIRSRPQE